MRSADSRRAETLGFAVPPPGKAGGLLLLGFTLVLPLAAITWLVTSGRAGIEAYWILALLLPIAIGITAFMQRRSVAIEDDHLVVRAAMYTQRIALEALHVDAARVISLDETREFSPMWKANGYAVPGFWAGHFRAGLKQRLFCLVTDRRRVLALPEHGGRVLLLSLERPHALIDAVAARTQPRSRR